MGWAKRQTRSIPSIGSSDKTLSFTDYSKGLNSFLANDVIPNSDKANYFRLVNNGRITTLGEYSTRKGVDMHSSPAGLTEDATQTSVTGAADQSFTEIQRLAQKFTTTSAGRLTKVEINIKNIASATGTVKVEVWTDLTGAPGVKIATSTIIANTATSTYAYLPARFVEAPAISAATDYWIVVYIQPIGANNYNWSSTTSDTTALISTDSGVTWVAQTFALNFKQSYATDGGVKGIVRAVKSDGTTISVFWHGTTMYTVDEVTSALTSIKTGLSASATNYRGVVVNDVLYYVNGFDGLRKWDFTTEAQVNSTDYTHITLHKGLLFLVRKDDPNRVDYSNFADYEVYTSTDFIYVPAPKTGDPITAVQSLNGYLMLWTQDNKYILSGDDNVTFSLDEAPDQKGTYTQETTTVDKNFAYYLSNDGVYRTNGSEATLISDNAYEELLRLPNRNDSIICVNKGRLYLWYRKSGADTNESCYVWNLNYGEDTIESLDTNSMIGRAVTAPNDNNQLLVGSSKVGQLFWQELESNNYDNAGGDIEFILQTHYNPYGDPSVLKELRYWNPRFGAQSGNYAIRCEYASDLRDDWTLYRDVNVQGLGVIWGNGTTWGGGAVYGSTAELQAQLYVPSEYRRIALRYKNFAARQPNTFLGQTIKLQTRRMR
jgi:hypothetical protein